MAAPSASAASSREPISTPAGSPSDVRELARDRAIDDDDEVGVESGQPEALGVGAGEAGGGVAVQERVLVAEGALDVRVLPRLVLPRGDAQAA
jgi:hypothetical protein